MCGLAGFLDLSRGQGEETMAALASGMAETLRHRGPDDRGVWVDAGAGIALGHRRLTIVDLSEHGHQPMVSPHGRYVLAYNGEVYNHGELSRSLAAEGHRFRGHCDTEVLLIAVEAWGLGKALDRVNGMFAFALWDRHERELTLGRDRLGEKPLYYGWMGPTLLFGSELKALRAHPRFDAEIDRGALALYFRHNCVPAPHSIYAGVSKLPPGTTLTVGAGHRSPWERRPVPYWSVRQVADGAREERWAGGEPELTDRLESLLADAVALRMHADVPLGAFLSGGIDSSTVVALMQAQSRSKVRTFTIGFDDAGYDESRDAERVARHLGTDHVSLRLAPGDALDVVPELPTLYDEPFADSSQIPTLLVSRLARREVTVSLSGDGGDELFGGYNRYAWCKPIWERASRVPRPLRRAGAAALKAVPPRGWDALFRVVDPILPGRLRVRNPGVKMQKLARVLPAAGLHDMYLRLVSHWEEPSALVLGAREAPSQLDAADSWPSLPDPVELMMYLDLVTYLPDDILAKVDRASMAVSLEARLPMLDPRLVEFAWRLPLTTKLVDGQGKWLLRQVLYRHVPKELVERPKMGFGLPLGDWLRGPLREWAEELLAPSRVRREGLLAPDLVRAAWEDHLAGHRAVEDRLWDVLMFQAWLDASQAPRACPVVPR